jgi:hypothetical protein
VKWSKLPIIRGDDIHLQNTGPSCLIRDENASQLAPVVVVLKLAIIGRTLLRVGNCLQIPIMWTANRLNNNQQVHLKSAER